MGIGGHLGMWEPVEERAFSHERDLDVDGVALNAAGFRTITYDQPGTGLSTPYRTPVA